MPNTAAVPSSAAGRALLAVLVGLLATACFFRVPVLNGFSELFGDVLDGRIETSILEHWFAALGGYEAWNQVAYFHPMPDSLGYNDGYFLYGVIFAAFRAIGLDPFLSSELVNITVHFAGFVFFLLFARRVARLSFGQSLLGGAVFTVANVLYVQTGPIGHVQLFTIGFAPPLALLGWECARALGRGDAVRAALTGSVAALFYGAWLLTGYYMAWFTTFFGCIMAAAAIVIRIATARRDATPLARPVARRMIWPVAVTLLVLVLSVLPFLRVYLPKARETGMHPVSTMMQFSPSLVDLLHFGDDNYLFGWLDHAIAQWLRPGFDPLNEHTIGFTPVLLVLALAGAVLAWRRSQRPMLFWRALSAAFIVSLIVVVHVGGHTIWVLIYQHVPGAAAVRTVTRYVLFLLIPAILLAMVTLGAIRARWSTALAAVVGALLLAEQFTATQPAHLDRAEQMRFLASVPAAPAACRSFYLRAAPDTPTLDFGALLRASVDAMMIAETRHVPTMNGAASFTPHGFDLLEIQQPGYVAKVANTAHEWGIEDGLCAFEPVRQVWSTEAFPLLVAEPGKELRMGATAFGGAPRYIGWGWTAPEGDGIWSLGPAVELVVRVAGAPITTPLELWMQGRSLVTPAAPPPRITVSANGRKVAEWHPAGDDSILTAIIPGGTIGADGVLHLNFDIDAPRVPQKLGIGGDPRELGLHVLGFTLAPLGTGTN